MSKKTWIIIAVVALLAWWLWRKTKAVAANAVAADNPAAVLDNPDATNP